MMTTTSRIRPLAAPLLILIFLLAFARATADQLQIHCIDVGEADCTLIVSPTGTTMMIDAAWYYNAGDIDYYLDNLGISYIDYFVATHYHADHIGGVESLVNDYGHLIGTVYDRGESYCTSTFENYYLPTVQDIRQTIADDQVIDLGGGVSVRCVSVNGNGQVQPPFIDHDCAGGGPAYENSFCVALVVSYGSFDFFVAGDLPGIDSGQYDDIETSVGPEAGDVEIYRVNHHGSYSSSNAGFLADIDPEVSIISVGQNSYGHPHPDVMDRLLQISVVYQTEDGLGNTVDGDIAILTDGSTSYTVNGDYYEIPGANPQVSIYISPDNPPIVIPPSGGSFTFDAYLTNNGNQPVTVDAWTEATLPNGSPYGPIDQVSVSLNAYEIKSFYNIPEQVPGMAPAGQYTFWAKVGYYPTAFDSSSFDFEKQAR